MPVNARRRCAAVSLPPFALAAVLALLPSRAAAQDYESPPPSAPAPPPIRFLMPDIQDSWMDWSRYDGRLFSIRGTIVPILDYNAFAQDDASIEQVGEQTNQWDLRTFRLMARGVLKSRHPVEYFVSLEIKGKDHVTGSEDSKVGFTDLSLATAIPHVGKLTFGKVKEPWIYEMVGDAANLQQEERVLSPFFVSRNIGVRVSNVAAGERMSWAAGWFNDWWIEDEAFDRSGNQFSGRITGLPLWSSDGSRYLHVGTSARYTGANEGTLRFRGRPESNVSSYYVDTGDLTASHANEIAFEALGARGPLLVSAEYVRAAVDSPANGDPAFWGAYIVASYILTGEHRPYDRSVGYARRVMPGGRGGAWEIFTRYSHVDLDDRSVAGGTFDRGTFGVTWWATRHWRIGIDYGITDLDRLGAHGWTNSIHPRFQWVY